MNPAGEVTISAARLRAGDHLVAHKASVVAHPPVVSPDGGLMTVILTFPTLPKSASRVVRIPVAQPVQVIRSAAHEHKKMVRKTKTAQSSGAQIAVLDLTQPDSEFAAINRHRYAVLCTVHHTIKFHTSVSTAEAISSHPEEWCPECADNTHKRAQARTQPTPLTPALRRLA